jgi:Undecaprenyl-phosphate galactose phosphotransferase WbaP
MSSSTSPASPLPNPVRLDILRWRVVPVILILLLGDIFSFGLAFWLATSIRSGLIPIVGGVLRWNEFIPLLQLNLISILATYLLTGLYPGFGRTAVEEMRQIFSSLTLGYAVLGLAVYLQKVGPQFPRSVFLLGWLFACIFDIIVRFAIRNRLSLYNWWGMPVMLVGSVEAIRDVISRLQRSRRLGLRPVLILDETGTPADKSISNIPVIASRSDFLQTANYYKIHYTVYVESPAPADPPTSQQTIRWLSNHFRTVLVAPSGSYLGSLWVQTMDLEGRLTLQTHYHLLDRKSIFLKRVFDLTLGTLLAVLLAPLLLLIGVIIKLDSPGPVIYARKRLGLNGKPFRYLKFRTMVQGADEQLDGLLESNPQAREEYQQHHKLRRDPRVTRIGKLLRKFSLDELPQIWHVLTGEMSLVGPRAYLFSEYPDMGSYADLIFKIRPGITGWWQVMGRHSTTFKHRLQLDEYYLSNWSLWLDIYILIKTGWVFLSGHGV